jgi:hypothetical protein
VPYWTTITVTTAQKPYFEDFVGKLQKQLMPAMIDPPIWLWICGTKDAEVQVSHYAHKRMFANLDDIIYLNYWPASNERLEDQAANNQLARGKVYLIFLIRKSYKASKKDIDILEAFAALRTLVYQKSWCNKLEY